MQQHGIGFTVQNSLPFIVALPTNGSERILQLQLSLSVGLFTLICIYASTLYSSPEVKNKFYESLDSNISSISKSGALYILGDLSARVGSDCNLWPMCSGCHGISNMNE